MDITIHDLGPVEQKVCKMIMDDWRNFMVREMKIPEDLVSELRGVFCTEVPKFIKAYGIGGEHSDQWKKNLADHVTLECHNPNVMRLITFEPKNVQ